jgi:HD-like signal output (HDOD) protein
MSSFKDIVDRLDQLAPIPPIANQIMALAEDPDSSLSEFAGLIINDPAIAANLLKTCNSAYFGLTRKVDSV